MLPKSASAILGVLLLKEEGYKRALEDVDQKLASALFLLYVFSVSLDALETDLPLGEAGRLLVGFSMALPLELLTIFLITHLSTGLVEDRRMVVRRRFRQLFRLLAISSIPAVFSFISDWLLLWSFACWVRATAYLCDLERHRLFRGLLAVVMGRAFAAILLYATGALIVLAGSLIAKGGLAGLMMVIVISFPFLPALYVMFKVIFDWE